MGPRVFLMLCFATLAIASLAAVAIGSWLIAVETPNSPHDLSSLVIVYGGGIAFLLVAAIALLWAYLDHALVQPITVLVRGIQTAIYARAHQRIEVPDFHQLGGLPSVVNELIRQLFQARGNTDDAVSRATERVEEQKNQLAIILQDLCEGVIVCNMSHKIILYNNRALELLRIGGELGLDRSLFHFMARHPILHALGRLGTHGNDDPAYLGARPRTVSFIGSTTDGRFTLEGRITLILDNDRAATGYVLSFEDDTEELAALSLRDRLLRDATEGLRGSIANLSAASEILCGSGNPSREEADAFKKVILRESRFLSERLEALAGQYREVITGHWPMTDIYVPNLVDSIIERLRERSSARITMIGMPRWLHGDSYNLVEVLDHLIRSVVAQTGTSDFDIECVPGERLIYLDICWEGKVIPASIVSGWLDTRLEDTLGGLSIRDVLERHRTDIWSLPDQNGRARLRMPLIPAQRTPTNDADAGRTPRPEFYDFELFSQKTVIGDLGQRPLRSLTYVVFDTETTGLAPSSGDEIVSIAGVRVVNGRILTGESFERLVNPRRDIPLESIRYHGVTPDMVKDKPPIQVVLPQFRSFVGDAILVAHNASFDLRFLTLREAECGVVFDMPVLDTLLLSAFLHDHSNRHSLDAAAERFGVPIQGRHTALGDALIAAAVFIKMIDILEARGVVTLEQAITASNSIVEIRAQQARY